MQSDIPSDGTEISVVVPTFNRRTLVVDAVRSVLPLGNHARIEVVVVDDCSTDGTPEMLQQEFRTEIERRVVRLLVNPINLGVTGAKNAGASAAHGQWVMFLDSDDLFRSEGAAELVMELNGARNAPLVFFRCMDFDGRRIGSASELPVEATLEDFLRRWKWGECLPVVRRSAITQFPYDVDLRGFEALAYFRITRALGPARISSVYARTYRTFGEDRLCSREALKARSCQLALGHWRTVREFAREMGWVGWAIGAAKVAYHAGRCIAYRTGVFGKARIRPAQDQERPSRPAHIPPAAG